VSDRSRLLAAVLERGADPLVADKANVTPLLAACRNGDAKTAMLLSNKPFTPTNRTVDNPEYVYMSSSFVRSYLRVFIFLFSFLFFVHVCVIACLFRLCSRLFVCMFMCCFIFTVFDFSN